MAGLKIDADKKGGPGEKSAANWTSHRIELLELYESLMDQVFHELNEYAN
jgi:hypothetical protein